MFRFVLSVFSPVISFFIFYTGSSILFTVLPLFLEGLNTSVYSIASLTTFFYAGCIFGALKAEKFILRVGFIRAYTAFASLIAVITLCHIFWIKPFVWLIFRFIYGFCLSGICLSIENWMLHFGNGKDMRGKVIAMYMIIIFGSQSLGQFLLRYFEVNTLIPFCVVACLTSLSMIPISATKIKLPSSSEQSIFGIKNLFAISPTGTLGSLFSGMLVGNVLGVLPWVLKELNYTVSDISSVMGVIILGGLILQYPIGRFSDKFERRTVLVATTVLALCITLILFVCVSYKFFAWFYLLNFVWGGVIFTIYPLSINLACDLAAPKDLLAMTSGLLVAYSVGASVGPLLSAFAISNAGPLGMYILFIIIVVMLLLFVSWRMQKRKPLPSKDQKEYTTVPRTTPFAMRLISKLKRKKNL